MPDLFENNISSSLVSTKIASDISGYNPDYLARVCREGKIKGTQVGRTWLIDRTSLEQFVEAQQERKRELAKQTAKVREQEYKTARTASPVSIPVQTAEAERIISPLQRLHFSRATQTVQSVRGARVHRPLVAAAVALVVTAGSAYASTAPQVQEAFAHLPEQVAHVADAVMRPRAIENGFRITEVPEKKVFAPELALPHAKTISQKFAYATGAPSNTYAQAFVAASDAPFSISSDTARVAQERITTFSFAVTHPVNTIVAVANTFVHAYVRTGADTLAVAHSVGDAYLNLVHSTADSSLATADVARTTIVSAPAATDALLALYERGTYSWVDSSHTVAQAATASVYDAGGTLGALATEAPHALVHAHDVLAQLWVDRSLALANGVADTQTVAGTKALAIASTIGDTYLGAVDISANALASAYMAVPGVSSLATPSQQTPTAHVATIDSPRQPVSFSTVSAIAQDTMLGIAGKIMAWAETNTAHTARDNAVADAPAQSLSASVISFMPISWQRTIQRVFTAGAELAQALIHASVRAIADTFSLPGAFSPELVVVPFGPTQSMALPEPTSLSYGSDGTQSSTSNTGTRTISTGPATYIQNIVNNITQSAFGASFNDAVLAIVGPYVQQSIDSAIGSVRSGGGGGGGGDNFSGTNAHLTNVTISGGTATLSTADIGELTAGSSTIDTFTTTGSTTLATTTVNGDLTVTGTISAGYLAVSSVTSTGTVYAPNFVAASTTATSTFPNLASTNADITNLLLGNGTSTNFFATNFSSAAANITNAVFGSFVSNLANITTAAITNLTGTNSEFVNSTTTNATTTNLYATNGVIDNATSTNSFATNLGATNAIFDNATSTNFFSALGSFTNAVFGSFVSNLANITTAAITNLTGTNSQFVNSTTTNAVATNATSTNLYSANGTIDMLNGTNATFSTTTTTNLVVTGSIASDLIPSANNQYNVGSPAASWNNAYFDSLHVNNFFVASTSIDGTASNLFSINSDNASADTEDSTLVFDRGSFTPNATLTWNSTLKRFDFNMPVQAPSLISGTIGTTANSPLNIVTNNAVVGTFLANGFLGLGTTTPTERLSVAGNALISGSLKAASLITTGNANVNSLTIGSLSGFLKATAGVVGTALVDLSTDVTSTLPVGNGGTGLASIPNAGDLLVGNGLGGYTLTSTSTLGLGGSFFQQNGNSFGTTASLGTNDANDLVFETNNTERLRVNTSGQLISSIASAANTPAFTWATDLTTGIFHPANNQIGFSTGGIQRIVVDGNGNLGVGSSSPNARLTVKGAGTTTGINFQTTNSSDTPLITVLDSGNVGIGTSTPSSALSVAGLLTVNRAGNQVVLADADGTLYASISSFVDSTTGGQLRFNPKNTGGSFAVAMTLLSNGNVGIGTTSPSARLTVKGAGTTTGVNFQTTNSSNTALVTMLDNGNVGIGTTTPTTLLSISKSTSTGQDDLLTLSSYGNVGTGRGPGILFQAPGGSGTAVDAARISAVLTSGGNTQADIVFENRLSGALSQSLIIKAGGNVGIGTSTPFAKLTLVGDLSISGGGIYDTNATRGTLGQVLQTTGTGIQWVSTTSLGFASSTSVGSANRVAYYNSGGVLGSTAGFTFDGTNLGVSGTITGTGQFIGIGGTGAANTPSYTFASDLTTGIYHPANNNVAISTGGIERLRVDGNGFIGIATSTPDAALTFSQAANIDKIHLYSSTAQQFGFGVYSSEFRNFAGSNSQTTWGTQNGSGVFTQTMSLSATGNLGIGTSTLLNTRLLVKGTSLSTNITFQTTDSNNNPLVTMLDNGNVGIGTTTPVTKLDVNSSASGAQATFSGTGQRGRIDIFRTGGTNNGLALFSDVVGSGISGLLDRTSSNYFQFFNHGTMSTAFGLTPVGGTASSSATVHAYAWLANRPAIIAQATSTQTANIFETRDVFGNALDVFSPAGNLGIGSTTPAANLSILNLFGSGNTNVFSISSSTNAGNTTSANLFNVNNVGSTTIAGSLAVAGGSFTDNTGQINLGVGMSGNGKAKCGIFVTDNFSGSCGGPANGAFLSSTILNDTNYNGYSAASFTRGSNVNALNGAGANATLYLNTNNSISNTSGGLWSQIQTVNIVDAGTSYANVAFNYVQGTAQLTNYVGFSSRGSYATAGPTVINQYDFRAESFANLPNGTTTNRYGLYIGYDNTSITNAYGVYQLSPTVQNFFGGNVGIGSTTPDSLLQIAGSDSGITIASTTLATANITNRSTTVNNFEDLTFSTANSIGLTKVTSKISGINTLHTSGSEAGNLVFSTASGGVLSEAMRILANNNVGIGTSSPQVTFHAYGTGLFQSSVANNNLSTFTATNLANPELTVVNRAASGFFGGIHVYSGNAGSGTFLTSDTVANGRWSVGGGYAGSSLYRTPQTAASALEQIGGALIYSYGSGLTINTNNSLTELFRITNTGNVGIGSSSPAAKLTIMGNGTGTGVNFQTTNSVNTPLVTMLDNGNVGIGTTTPGVTLTVGGDFLVTGRHFDSFASPGIAGQVLLSTATGTMWGNTSGTGTVTSVDASGGTTGLTFSGGPITSAGTLTLAGTLGIANGGTGTTTGGTTNGVEYYNGTNLTNSPNFTFNGSALALNGTQTITSASTSAFAVGANGATNPAFAVDASTASAVAGITIKAGASGSGPELLVNSSGTNENLKISAKGTGTITIGSSSTGNVAISRAATFAAGATITGAASVTTTFTAPTIMGGSAVGSTLTIKSTSGAGTTDAIIFATGSSVERARFTSGGNFGIGTTTPGSLLTVGGNIMATGTVMAGDGVAATPGFVFSNGTTGFYRSGNNLNVSVNGTATANFAGGKLGLASTGVFGFSSNGGPTVADLGISRQAAGVLAVGNGTAGDFSATLIANSVGIGTSTPGAQLTTTGTVQFANYGSAGATVTTDANGNLSVSSDERLKNINGSFTRGLADIEKLSPILYHWNAVSGLDQNSQYAGFSAQNVQSTIPEAVATDARGYLTLADRPIIAASVNAIKELAGQTGVLATTTASMAGRLASVEAATTAQSAAYQAAQLPHAFTATEVTAQSLIIAMGVSAGTLTTHSVNADGTVSAARYVVPATAEVFTTGSTTMALVLPDEVLTDGGVNVDVYKLASYAVASVQALSSRTDLLATRIDSIDTRLSALESAATATSSISQDAQGVLGLAAASVQHILESFGLFIRDGIAQISTLVTHQLVLSSDTNGTSSAASVVIPAGQTEFKVDNLLVLPTSKIFITFTSSVNGSWYISKKEQGSFTVTLGSVQATDTAFDYFLVQTEGQIASVVAAPAPSTPAPTAPTDGGAPVTPAPVSQDGGPVVTLTGDAAVQIPQGAAWTDPGASAKAADGTDLSSSIAVSGGVDTNTPGLYTVTYRATDSAGKYAEASRIVTVLGAPTSAPAAPADSTPAVTAAPTDSSSASSPAATAPDPTPAS